MSGKKGFFDRMAEAADKKFFNETNTPGNNSSNWDIKGPLEDFDKHAILYLFGIAVLICPFFTNAKEPLVAGLGVGIIFCVIYYVLKAAMITTSTVVNWETDHPGEPMFKSSGLTAYDREFAETVGRAAGEAKRGTNPGHLTSYDRGYAAAIAREINQDK